MHEPYLKRMQALLRRSTPRHDLYTVFGDCMEAIALALSNGLDHRQYARREARYLEIVGRYEQKFVEIFPNVMAELAMALEAEPGDVLGALFHDLELHNKARGQFFTPYSVSRPLAEITLGDDAAVRARIEDRGFISALEPACGAGSMIIALADAMRNRGINYQRHLHVTAIDIDPRAIHMAYSQFSLLHIPAHLMVGDSLSGEMQEHWFTPAHLLGGWSARLAAADLGQSTGEPVSPVPPAPVPPRANPPQTTEAPQQNTAASPRQLSLF